MIVYDLRCDNDHLFEGWFQHRTAYEDQQTRKLILCPVCGCDRIRIAPSSVMHVGKASPANLGGKARELNQQKAFHLLTDSIARHCEDVGDRFTEVAVKMHRGLEEERNIRGTATEGDERYLQEEGISYFKIPSRKLDS